MKVVMPVMSRVIISLDQLVGSGCNVQKGAFEIDGIL